MDITFYLAASIATLLALVAVIAGHDSRDGFESLDHHTTR